MAAAARNRAESFAGTREPDGSFDLVVGNVPFGKLALHDRAHSPGGHSIHKLHGQHLRGRRRRDGDIDHGQPVLVLRVALADVQLAGAAQLAQRGGLPGPDHLAARVGAPPHDRQLGTTSSTTSGSYRRRPCACRAGRRAVARFPCTVTN